MLVLRGYRPVSVGCTFNGVGGTPDDDEVDDEDEEHVERTTIAPRAPAVATALRAHGRPRVSTVLVITTGGEPTT